MKIKENEKSPEIELNLGSRPTGPLPAGESGAKLALSPLAKSILEKRYLRRSESGEVLETHEDMLRRVANTIAEVESSHGATTKKVADLAKRFYDLMASAKFLPNSPTLMNSGRNDGMLSACFVLPVEDSVEGIFEAVKNAALVQKAGGGTGFSFDRLRPTGDRVASSGGKTSGLISFMRVFSEATHSIQQGAFRRGANMGMMSVEHPDILKFINAKRDTCAFTNFNLSIKVPDAFMEKLSHMPGSLHVVVNPRTGKRYVIPYSVNIDSYSIDELPPANKETCGCYTIQEIWNIIVRNTHATGEPGVCFIDRVNQDNPTPALGPIEATNPCGEQPLLPYEACNLGSINIAQFIGEGRADLDWKELEKTVTLGVRFLDNVVDASYWPVPEIREKTLGNRKIGLGVMGFADALVLLGIRYDSKEALLFASKLASFIQEHAHKASEELAKKRGCFPNWAGSIWDTKYHRPMRNAACTTIAPTGTISIIAGCTSGIEPIFDIASKRRGADGQEFVQICPIVERLGTKGGWLTEKVRNLLVEGVSPADIPEIPKRLAEVVRTAHQISPEWHVRIQAAFQRFTDNALSKTVNLPSGASIEDVDKVFHLAYELGCKGITVYRDGCRENQVITAANKTVGPAANTVSLRPRPRKTSGDTTKFRIGCGTLFVTVNRDDYGVCEIFTLLGKAGGCPSQSEATSRVISAALRCSVDPKVLVEQLKNIRCLSTVSRRKTDKDIDVLSCPDAIARAIEEALGDNREVKNLSVGNRCPDCGHPLRREEGCNVCDNCAYRKCG